RRGFQMVMVVIAATIAIYVLLNAVPGGPLSGINVTADRRARFTAEEIARMEAALGLNQPRYLAYLVWMGGEDWLDDVGNALGNPRLNDKLVLTGTWSDYQTPRCQAAGGTNAAFEGTRLPPCGRGILRGDFGTSWRLAKGVPVTEVLGDRVMNTVRLTATASILSLLIAIPIGIISAVRQYSRLDYAVTTFS